MPGGAGQTSESGDLALSYRGDVCSLLKDSKGGFQQEVPLRERVLGEFILGGSRVFWNVHVWGIDIIGQVQVLGHPKVLNKALDGHASERQTRLSFRFRCRTPRFSNPVWPVGWFPVLVFAFVVASGG